MPSVLTVFYNQKELRSEMCRCPVARFYSQCVNCKTFILCVYRNPPVAANSSRLIKR